MKGALQFVLSALLIAGTCMGQEDEVRLGQKAVERLVKYAGMNTQSKEDAGQVPSTPGQFELARLLTDELRTLGLRDVRMDDERCYVYASVPSNIDVKGAGNTPAVGFIAHLDVSPSVAGGRVNPIIHKNYRGGDIVLQADSNRIITVRKNPDLMKCIGDDIVTTDGTTLLGADDKAGIAEIMTAVEYLVHHPEIKHGAVKVAFTPDEEVGNGPKYFDIEGFGAQYAYTVDGGALGEFSDETFNARLAIVTFLGKNTHPGDAKGVMVNSLYSACWFVSQFPEDMRPETTEGRDGYVHPYDFTGTEERTKLKVLIRDFDRSGLEEKTAMLEKLKTRTLEKFPAIKMDIKVTDTYRNMNSVLSKHPEIVRIAEEAMKDARVKPVKQAARGGTDGSQLTFMGLPTPNIFAGEENAHSRMEWIPARSMAKSVLTIVNIARLSAAQRDSLSR